MIPDWQLPPGVNRGLWDYLQSREMVAGYDAQMAATPLAAADIAFCEKHFQPGRLLDLGCGTGRLARHFAARGFECVGVDLSEAMLEQARAAHPSSTWLQANIVERNELADGTFHNVACLFSTLGMVNGEAERAAVVANAFRLLQPGGCFVVHAHHRGYSALGWRRFITGDFTMPQAYGGAPLTIHHFRRTEILKLLQDAGFAIKEIAAIDTAGRPVRRGAYGFLIAAPKPY